MRNHHVLRKMSIILAIITIIVLLCFSYFENNIKKIVYDMAEAQVTALATGVFNSAVAEVFQDDLDYSMLMTIIRDNNGDIAMINADAVKMNQLSSKTASLAQQKLSALSDTSISIPIGSMFNSQLLSGRGPKINIKIIPVGAVSTQFVTEFQHAGINQTRHKIYLLATTSVKIVIPTGSSTVKVNSYVPISESIIIGEVPESFVMVEDDNLMNLIPDVGN